MTENAKECLEKNCREKDWLAEKEKARQGLLYDAGASNELICRERSACQALCYEYNQLPPWEYEKRSALIRKILAKTGERFVIEQPFKCDLGYNVEIGEDFYANYGCIILDGARVRFGDHVFIAPNCTFTPAGHPLDAEQRNKGLEYAYPITVGNNVWIGAHTVVLAGVTIGDNTVIGAGSMVNRDIPSGVIAAGNPCRVIREITEEDSRKYGF